MMTDSGFPSQLHVDPQLRLSKPFLDESQSAATLLVRYLPEAIPHQTLSRLFSHYGSSFVLTCAGGRSHLVRWQVSRPKSRKSWLRDLGAASSIKLEVRLADIYLLQTPHKAGALCTRQLLKGSLSCQYKSWEGDTKGFEDEKYAERAWEPIIP